MIDIWSYSTDFTLFFWLLKRDVAIATNFRVKWEKSADSPSFVALAFLNGVEYRKSDFNSFICYDLATSCKTLVNFDSLTPQFENGKDVHPLVDQQFGYAAPPLDLVGISTEFSGAITTKFCFTYTLDCVTAMPRGLHARLCHAYLVNIRIITHCERILTKRRIAWGRFFAVFRIFNYMRAIF